MANKYLIHGATYCGDGTASNEAASAGAAGAWNDINVLTGSAPAYGTLSAGDVVYIRSKTSAGANILITLGASISIGKSTATAAAWITWILDNGAVWSGISGELRIDCPLTYTVSCHNYNRFISAAQDAFVIKETNASASNKSTVILAPLGGEVVSALFDLTIGQGTHGCQLTTNTGNTLRAVHLKSHTRYAQLFAAPAPYGVNTYIDCDIELLNAAETDPLWTCGSYGGIVRIFGGVVRGVGATTGVKLFDLASGQIECFGLQYPTTMDISKTSSGAIDCRRMISIGADGAAGSAGTYGWGVLSSRNDGYFPTLNATLPDSANTPWSWWMYPSHATKMIPAEVVVSKMYTSAAAIKTLTLEFLLATGFTTVNRENCHISVSYVDAATGLPKNVSSFSAGAETIDTSTASWTATTYGAVNLNKYKLAITTPTTIKQDTLVTVVFRFGVASANANQILFVDPDVQLT